MDHPREEMLESAGVPDATFEGKAAEQAAAAAEVNAGFLAQLVSPLNLVLLTICAFLLYQIIKGRRAAAGTQGGVPPLKPLKKRDFTLEQLRAFNGTQEGGRILIAVNGKVFDVTKAKNFYGPVGPYGVFAGRDASRSLGTFSLTDDTIRDTWDDLSDLKTAQMDKIREWEIQFTEKYDVVGRLLRAGEEPTDYSDTEEEHSPNDRSKSD